MKMLRSRSLALLAFIATGLLQPVYAQELLTKYGFEDIPAHIPNWGAGYQGQYKPATGWKTPFMISLDKTDPHSGTVCLQVEVQQAEAGLIRVHSPAIPLPAEAAEGTVQIHAFARMKDAAADSVAVGLLENNGENKPVGFVGGKEKFVVLEPSEDWQEITCEGPLNARTRSVTVMFTIQSQATSAILWLDDIAIEWTPK